VKALLFVYALTYGGAVISLFRPFHGLCIYIAFAIVKPEQIWWWSVPPGNYSRIIAIGLLVGWLANGLGTWKFGRGSTTTAALVGFWLWSVFSALNAYFPEPAWLYIDNLSKIVLPFVVGVTIIQSRDQLFALAGTIAVSIGYIAYRENELYLTWGIYEGDNQKAHIMAAAAGFLFFFGVCTTKWWQRILAFGSSALAAHAVMFHMSRGGMLGLSVAGLLTFVVVPKTPKWLIGFAIAIAVIARLAGPAVRDEFRTIFADEEVRDESATSRIEFWDAMWRATKEHPVLGVGPRNWVPVSYRYGIPGREGHGMWQQLAAETGIPGASLIALFYISAIGLLLPCACGLAKTPHSASFRPFAQMCVVSMAAWAVEQCFGSFYLVELPYYFGLVAAVTLRLMSSESAAHQEVGHMALVGRS